MAITDAQQAKQIMMKKGGPVHRHQLAKKRKDGKRPGYYGPDMGHAGEMGGKGFGRDAYSGGPSDIDMGGGPGGSDRDFARTRQAVIDRNREAARKEEEKRRKEEKKQKDIKKEKEIQKTKKAQTKKIKDFITADDLLDEPSKLDDSRFDKADLNKDGKVGFLEKFNYNARKKKQKAIQDRIDKKIRSGLKTIDPDINLTRSIKEMEMYADPKATYGDLVKEAVLGGSTFGNKGDLIGAQFEKYSPKEGSAKEKYNYQPDFLLQ